MCTAVQRSGPEAGLLMHIVPFNARSREKDCGEPGQTAEETRCAHRLLKSSVTAAPHLLHPFSRPSLLRSLILQRPKI
jgi:hypothetical protein